LRKISFVEIIFYIEFEFRERESFETRLENDSTVFALWSLAQKCFKIEEVDSGNSHAPDTGLEIEVLNRRRSKLAEQNSFFRPEQL
jgi:hypothetical protein